MEDKLQILADIKAWCQEVGAYQRQMFRSKQLRVSTKSHIHDLVTEVDQESERLIIKHIKQRYPHTSILAEESGQDLQSSDYLWVIDPLDGTNNYSQGLPIFAISIALQYQGQTELGVVYAPYLNEMFSAIKGQGAFLNEQSISVSPETDLQKCVLGTGFPYDKASHPINNLAYFAHLLPQVRGMRRLGAAAYDLCAVASGWLDGYWELGLSLWDIAAGALIVEEAGGKVIAFRDDRQHSIIAANPSLAETIRQEL